MIFIIFIQYFINTMLKFHMHKKMLLIFQIDKDCYIFVDRFCKKDENLYFSFVFPTNRVTQNGQYSFPSSSHSVIPSRETLVEPERILFSKGYFCSSVGCTINLVCVRGYRISTKFSITEVFCGNRNVNKLFKV